MTKGSQHPRAGACKGKKVLQARPMPPAKSHMCRIYYVLYLRVLCRLGPRYARCSNVLAFPHPMKSYMVIVKRPSPQCSCLGLSPISNMAIAKGNRSGRWRKGPVFPPLHHLSHPQVEYTQGFKGRGEDPSYSRRRMGTASG